MYPNHLPFAASAIPWLEAACGPGVAPAAASSSPSASAPGPPVAGGAPPPGPPVAGGAGMPVPPPGPPPPVTFVNYSALCKYLYAREYYTKFSVAIVRWFCRPFVRLIFSCYSMTHPQTGTQGMGPPPPNAGGPPAAAAPAPAAAAAPAPPANGTMYKDDPRYKKYFVMIKVGVGIPQVCASERACIPCIAGCVFPRDSAPSRATLQYQCSGSFLSAALFLSSIHNSH